MEKCYVCHQSIDINKKISLNLVNQQVQHISCLKGANAKNKQILLEKYLKIKNNLGLLELDIPFIEAKIKQLSQQVKNAIYQIETMELEPKKKGV